MLFINVLIMTEETTLPGNRILYVGSWLYTILIPLVIINQLFQFLVDDSDLYMPYPETSSRVTATELIGQIFAFLTYFTIFYISFQSRKNYTGRMLEKGAFRLSKRLFIIAAIITGFLYIGWVVFNLTSVMLIGSASRAIGLILFSLIQGATAFYLTASLIYFKRNKLIR